MKFTALNAPDHIGTIRLNDGTAVATVLSATELSKEDRESIIAMLQTVTNSDLVEILALAERHLEILTARGAESEDAALIVARALDLVQTYKTALTTIQQR